MLQKLRVSRRWSVQVEEGFVGGRKEEEGIQEVKERKEREGVKKVKDYEGEG